jgi:hypothetical protein
LTPGRRFSILLSGPASYIKMELPLKNWIAAARELLSVGRGKCLKVEGKETMVRKSYTTASLRHWNNCKN